MSKESNLPGHVIGPGITRQFSNERMIPIEVFKLEFTAGGTLQALLPEIIGYWIDGGGGGSGSGGGRGVHRRSEKEAAAELKRPAGEFGAEKFRGEADV